MPVCQKFNPNCFWQVPVEWFGLNFNSALLTKVYWNYTTHIVRVCIAPLFPISPLLHVSNKSNIPIKFGSRAMISLYEFLCHHSVTKTNPLLEELLSNLPTRFLSHILVYVAYATDNESVDSVDSSISAFYSYDSSFFLKNF